MAYPLDETASMASSNLDKCTSAKSSFLGHVHTYSSALLKQNMDMAYY